MTSSDRYNYHRQRAEHCRAMANSTDDPDIRRRHEELAALHSSRAGVCSAGGEQVELSAA